MLAFTSPIYTHKHRSWHFFLYHHTTHLQPPPPPHINNQPTNIMGNCQAIDNASLIIQHPNGKVERLYATITAAEVMKLNPGHYVALLLTTTLYSSRPPSTTAPTKQNSTGATVTTSGQPLRITRIKLLRPTESLTVGHIYRLITTQEVMKGLMAKKNGKVSDYMKKPVPVATEELAGKNIPAAIRSNQSERTHQQMKRSEKDRKTAAAMKARGWHPSLNSISEASS
ncbi:hypothetical protein M8C21_007380 [Ambrosia artemisiifolia]|uniref:Uncharacterized protein n=1 Tax=Ambrosia artemisiifolia TaxID=4212 RepID=A0AAD5BT62_AMBAR|nr:hypothetical protein M8C21_007380 [Ambrosia artemisiifolia]